MIENVLGRLKDGDAGAALPAPPALSPSPSLTPRDIKAKYGATEPRTRPSGGGGGGLSAANSLAPARPRSRRASCALECGALALPLPGVAANVLQPTADVLQKLSALLAAGEEEQGGSDHSAGGTLTVPRARPRASIDLGSFCKGRGGRSPRRMRGASEADVMHYERRYGYATTPTLAVPGADSPLLLSTEVSATEDEDASDMELVVQSTRAPSRLSRAEPSPAPPPLATCQAAVPVAGGWRGCCIIS